MKVSSLNSKLLISPLLGLSLILISLCLLGLITVVHAASITVNSLADEISDDGECTLREAIIAANTDTASGLSANECLAGFGDDVIDLTGINGTIALSSTLPDINSNLVIAGPGIERLTIDGRGSVRVFKITGGDVTVSGVKIANGYIGPHDGQGGAIFNSSSGSLTVTDSILFNNQAKGADGTNYNTGGISGCCFAGGGGIFQSGTGTLNLVNSMVVSNVTIGGRGGLGSYTTGGGGGGGSFGGGLFVESGTVNIITSVFSANKTIGGYGGDIASQGNTTFSGGGGGGQADGFGGGGKGGDSIGTSRTGEDGNFGGGGGGSRYPSDHGTLGGFGAGHGGTGGAGPDHFPYGGGGGGGAGLGGGIFNSINGSTNVVDSLFIDNQVFGGGGGASGYDAGESGQGIGYDIFNLGQLMLTNTAISNTVPILDNFTPAAGTTDVPLNQTLNWNASDMDGDILTFDMAFGDNPNLLNEVKNISPPFVIPISLNPFVTYYWVMTVTDGLTSTSSGLLSFTTALTPTANFDAAPQKGPIPLDVTFSNSSTDASEFLWSFGDGYTSPVGSPTHIYNTSGLYTVSLRATGAGGVSWLTRTNYITAGQPPQAGFVAYPVIGLYTLTTYFTNTSLYADTYLWDYGDGSTSVTSALTHTHTYSNTGPFTVSLTASSEYGNDQLTEVGYINVYTFPVADFVATPLTGTKPLVVNFMNISQGAADFQWDFGDGAGSTMVSPQHTYTATGNYSVTLTASNPFLSDTLTRTAYITVGTKPVVNFYTDSTVGQSPFTVTFTNTSLYADTYLWDYGDGSTSATSALTHTHTYTAPGYYRVSLTGYSLYGSSRKDNYYIYVTDVPLVDFSAEPRQGLSPLTVTFINHSLFADSYVWDYGDGQTSNTTQITHTHAYTTSGTYQVTLIATNTNGVVTHTEQAFIRVYDIPTSSFSAQPLTNPVPSTVTFTNSSTGATAYLWDFGDGSTGTTNNPTHIYNAAGIYTITLTAKNPVAEVTLTRTSYITTYNMPSADFTGIPSIGTVLLDVNFINNSQHADAYQWDYGDGVTSTVAMTEHNHTYTSPGVYTVTLTANNAYTQNTRVIPSYIVVYVPPLPTDYYVDANHGDDFAGNGSQAAPWKTLSRALSLVGGPGIIIHLAPGLYNEALGENFPLIIQSGTKILGSAPELVTISGNGSQAVFEFPATVEFNSETSLEFIRIENGGFGIRIYGSTGLGSFVTISNTVIAGNQTGIHLLAEDSKKAQIHIERSEISNNWGMGINLESTVKGQGIINLEYCQIKNNGSYGVRSYTYAPGNGSYAAYSTISLDHSEISGNDADGVIATGQFFGRSTIDSFNSFLVNNNGYGFRVDQLEWNMEVVSNFANNVIANNANGGVFLSEAPQMKVSGSFVNNTIVYNNAYGIEFEPTNYGGIDIANTIIWGHTDDLTGVPLTNVSHSDVGDTDYTGTNNNISEDPQFINPSQGDYHVSSTSPVIDAGNSTHPTLPSIDIDGDPRILGIEVDMGADEFNNSIPSSGGILTLSPGVTITVDSGVFSDTILVTYTPHSMTSTDTLSNVGIFYELSTTYLSSGLPAQPQSGRSYTITVTYRQEDVPNNINEADLALYYWDGNMWIKEPTSVVNVDTNTITATPDHFSLWAALGVGSSSISQRIFLPIILRP